MCFGVGRQGEGRHYYVRLDLVGLFSLGYICCGIGIRMGKVYSVRIAILDYGSGNAKVFSGQLRIFLHYYLRLGY